MGFYDPCIPLKAHRNLNYHWVPPRSGECLLEQLGVVKDLPHTHAVMSLWPALLVAPWPAHGSPRNLGSAWSSCAKSQHERVTSTALFKQFCPEWFAESRVSAPRCTFTCMHKIQVVLAIVKGGWLAVVVGVNVFLPAFVAGFGKQLGTRWE